MAQAGIARQVTVAIIDLFEVIQIQHQYRHRLSTALGACACACQFFAECLAIVQAGEPVTTVQFGQAQVGVEELIQGVL